MYVATTSDRSRDRRRRSQSRGRSASRPRRVVDVTQYLEYDPTAVVPGQFPADDSFSDEDEDEQARLRFFAVATPVGTARSKSGEASSSNSASENPIKKIWSTLTEQKKEKPQQSQLLEIHPVIDATPVQATAQRPRSRSRRRVHSYSGHEGGAVEVRPQLEDKRYKTTGGVADKEIVWVPLPPGGKEGEGKAGGGGGLSSWLPSLPSLPFLSQKPNNNNYYDDPSSKQLALAAPPTRHKRSNSTPGPSAQYIPELSLEALDAMVDLLVILDSHGAAPGVDTAGFKRDSERIVSNLSNHAVQSLAAYLKMLKRLPPLDTPPPIDRARLRRYVPEPKTRFLSEALGNMLRGLAGVLEGYTAPGAWPEVESYTWG